MQRISETHIDGVTELRFDVSLAGERVPGIRWAPDATAAVPTILVGHGGFQSKEVPNIVAMARSMAQRQGWATIALDAPGHGDRRTDEQIRQQDETLQRLRREGVPGRRGQEATPSRGTRTASPAGDDRPDAGGRPALGPDAAMPRMAREWKALLDHIAGTDLAGSSYGYWGVSMGARNGIPLVANEPRIAAAVFGLFAYLPDPVFREQVASITIPLLFLFQYDDELMAAEAGLALWNAFGSAEKTMHINPGPHVGIPAFERESSAAFFARHLS